LGQPGNVLVAVTPAGEQAYVCDFGLARHVSGGDRNDPSTIGCFSANWSPDGSKIIFERFSGNQGDVYTVNPDGTDLTEVTGTPDDEGGPPNWGTHPITP